MTTLAEVRNTDEFRVHGDLAAFTVTSLNDTNEARRAFGALTNQLAGSPVPGYEHDLRMTRELRPYEIGFRKI